MSASVPARAKLVRYFHDEKATFWAVENEDGLRYGEGFHGNGGLHFRWRKLADGRTQYTAIFDAEGRDMIPSGDGVLHQYLGTSGEDEQWIICGIRQGFMHGEWRLMDGRMLARRLNYVDGVEQRPDRSDTRLVDAINEDKFISVDECRALIEAGASMDNEDAEGMSPLHRAVWHLREDLVDFLLDQGALPRTKYRGMDPLHHAAMLGHQPLCQRFLDFGFDINARGPDFMTPLACAALIGYEDLCVWLIAVGADPLIPAKKRSQLPSVIAAESGFPALAERLQRLEEKARTEKVGRKRKK